MTTTPERGVPFVIGAEVLIPTYVAESEAPRADGGCITHRYEREADGINAAGWYVEYHYPDETPGIGVHRRFIPFGETTR